MIFSQAWERYRAHLGQFLLVGLVGELVTLGVPVAIFLIFGGTGMLMALAGGALEGNPAAVLKMAGAAAMGALLALVAGLLVGSLGSGMQMAAARDALSGAEVSVGRALAGASRCWGRIVGYGLLFFLTEMVVAVVAVIPVLGWLVYLAALLLLSPAFFYGLYALVAEGLSAGAAYGRAWQGLGKRLGEHFLAGLVLIGISLAVVLVAVLLGFIPLVGWIADLVLFLLLMGFLPVYLGLRYQMNVRPYLAEQQPPVPPFPQGPTA